MELSIITKDEMKEVVVDAVRTALRERTLISSEQKKSNSEHYMTFREVAKKLRISAPTLRSKLKNGELHGVKLGKAWRIPEASLQEYFQKTERK